MRRPVKILSKEEWGGHPTRKDIEGEITTEVKLPAKYVLISATNTRPCVALEDCAILMKTYQEYFLFHGYSDVPFNFVVGPGKVVLEGKGWHVNSLDFREEKTVKDSAWQNYTEVTGVLHKIPELRRLKRSLGFKKPLKYKEKKQEEIKKIQEKIKEDEVMETLGRKNKDDLNKYFGRTVVIGLIGEVFLEGDPCTRALSSALALIRHGVRENLIQRKYELMFNFDPVYKLDKMYIPRDSPFAGVMESLYVYRNRRLEDFIDHFMFPSMKP